MAQLAPRHGEVRTMELQQFEPHPEAQDDLECRPVMSAVVIDSQALVRAWVDVHTVAFVRETF